MKTEDKKYIKTTIALLSSMIVCGDDKHSETSKEAVEKSIELLELETPSNKSSELPSDEEIEQVATDKSHEAWTVSNCRTTFQEAFVYGAKWMRSKLQTRETKESEYWKSRFLNDLSTLKKDELQEIVNDIKSMGFEGEPITTPSTEWISVEDRLPKKYGKYLVYWQHDGSVSMKVWNNTKFGYTENVTHWQPLPSPPKQIKA